MPLIPQILILAFVVCGHFIKGLDKSHESVYGF